jgi:diacylglycerol kinase family enzyme
VKTRFIVNARSGRASKALPFVRAFAERTGAGIQMTQRPCHGAELARQAVDQGCELIVAVGGDGTMNEVASQLVGTPATLGLVPCGSGDGLGRHLRIHGRVERALSILLYGRPRVIDTGIADGHPFFTASGIGFEAEIAHRFNQLQRRGFGRYLTTSARAFRDWQPQNMVITHDGGRTEVRAFTLAVANADQYGNDARIAPGARADDGEVNLTAIPQPGIINSLPLLARLFSGSIDRARGVVALHGTRFVIDREHAGWLHTDGELHSAGRVLEFTVRPASLRIMTPAE